MLKETLSTLKAVFEEDGLHLKDKHWEMLRIKFKSYGARCSEASLEKGHKNAELFQAAGHWDIICKSVVNPDNIVYLDDDLLPGEFPPKTGTLSEPIPGENFINPYSFIASK